MLSLLWFIWAIVSAIVIIGFIAWFAVKCVFGLLFLLTSAYDLCLRRTNKTA